MAVAFSATTDKVTLPTTPAALDDLSVSTIAAWVYHANAGTINDVIYQKGLTTAVHAMTFETTDCSVFYGRATGNCNATTARSNFSAYAQNKWLFVAGQIDTGTLANNKLWMGDLATLAAEPSSYGTQSLGSGAHSTNAGASPIIGNRSSNNRAWIGRIAIVYVFPSLLTQEELWRLQFNSFSKASALNIHLLSTTQEFDYSGNGFNGTNTGATLADHVPLGDIFRAKRGRAYVAAGGTTYFSTPSGALTPAGALTKLTARTLAGAVTPTGSIVTQTARILSGSITPSAVENALTARALAGSITPAGALTAASVFLKSLAGAITPAASLVLSTLKSLTGTLTPVGAAVRAIATARTSGGLSPSGAIVKSLSRALAGTLSLAATLAGVLNALTGSLNGVIKTSTSSENLPHTTSSRNLSNTTETH